MYVYFASTQVAIQKVKQVLDIEMTENGYPQCT